MIVSETRERFLNAILTQIPLDQIAEIHLFQPIKQGGVESGVAVIAAETPKPPAALAALEALAAPASALRHVVYTARYRLTLKGPDRGKWETNVVAEADAPLITVDMVVRGVQRRAGDAEDPVRLTGEELRAVVHQPVHPAA